MTMLIEASAHEVAWEFVRRMVAMRSRVSDILRNARSSGDVKAVADMCYQAGEQASQATSLGNAVAALLGGGDDVDRARRLSAEVSGDAVLVQLRYRHLLDLGKVART